MTLPLRSYVLVFRVRESAGLPTAHPAAAIAPIVQEHPSADRPAADVTDPGRRANFRWPLVAVVSTLVVVAAGAGLVHVLGNGEARSIVIHTSRGDILHQINDVPGDGIQLGPRLSEVDEVTVRMTFSPVAAEHQGGIMVFENADRYVKLGRQFTSRNQWEFGLETRARYQKPPGTFTYDSTGQEDAPTWLSIRRNHDLFDGFVSNDGVNWRKIGNTLRMPDPMPGARAAVYAYNGRTNAPAAVARFDHLRIGPYFHDSPFPGTNTAPVEGWTSRSTCGDELGAPQTMSASLDFLFRGGARGRCDWTMTRPVPAGDWTLQTRLDFQFDGGTIAGLIVTGKDGYLRLIRWGINNGSITAEHSGYDQVSKPDFPGNPPLTLRIECKSGILHASFSRDDRNFIDVPNEVPLKGLGDDVRFGLHAGFSSWAGDAPPPPAHFYYVQQLVRTLNNYR